MVRPMRGGVFGSWPRAGGLRCLGRYRTAKTVYTVYRLHLSASANSSNSAKGAGRCPGGGRPWRSRCDRAGAFRPVGDVKHSPSSGAVCSPTGYCRHHPIQPPGHVMARRPGLSVTDAAPPAHDLVPLGRRVHVPGPLLNKYSRNPPMTASEFHLPSIDSQQESPT